MTVQNNHDTNKNAIDQKIDFTIDNINNPALRWDKNQGKFIHEYLFIKFMEDYSSILNDTISIFKSKIELLKSKTDENLNSLNDDLSNTINGLNDLITRINAIQTKVTTINSRTISNLQKILEDENRWEAVVSNYPQLKSISEWTVQREGELDVIINNIEYIRNLSNLNSKVNNLVSRVSALEAK